MADSRERAAQADDNPWAAVTPGSTGEPAAVVSAGALGLDSSPSASPPSPSDGNGGDEANPWAGVTPGGVGPSAPVSFGAAPASPPDSDPLAVLDERAPSPRAVLDELASRWSSPAGSARDEPAPGRSSARDKAASSSRAGSDEPGSLPRARFDEPAPGCSSAREEAFDEPASSPPAPFDEPAPGRSSAAGPGGGRRASGARSASGRGRSGSGEPVGGESRPGRDGRQGRAGFRGTAPVDQREQAREICLRQLQVRPRTRLELATALRRKGIEDDIAAELLDRYDEVGIIDDAAFAKAWVTSRHHGKGLARRALAGELRRKGVADDEVGDALDELAPELEEDTARRLVERKLRVESSAAPDAVFRRLVGMLARKGYPAGLAIRVVKDALAARAEQIEQEQLAEFAEGIDADALAEAAEPDSQ